VAGAQAARRQTARHLPEEERQLRPVPGRRSTVLHSKLVTRLIAFGICVALLAVGRVALSFAVVQKNLQTSALIKQELVLRDENMNLADLVAQQTASGKVQNLARKKYGLVEGDLPVFLSVHPDATPSRAPAP
jgi:cell division protein FtsB